MQVNKQNIQRPSLIEPFFNKELTPSNEFVTYIDCTNNFSNVVYRKNVTSDSHNIKKSLKTKKIIEKMYLVILKRKVAKIHGDGKSSRQMFYTPLSHNNILSLM